VKKQHGIKGCLYVSQEEHYLNHSETLRTLDSVTATSRIQEPLCWLKWTSAFRN